MSELQRGSQQENRGYTANSGHSQVGLRGTDKGAELALVLTLNVLKREDGCSLLVHDGAEAGLTLDDDVRNTHLAAERGEKDDELDRVDVVCDDDKRRLLGLNKGNTVVQTVLDKQGLLRVLMIAVRRSQSKSH